MINFKKHVFSLTTLLLAVVAVFTAILATDAQEIIERSIANSIDSWTGHTNKETGTSLEYPTGPKWIVSENERGEISVLNSAGVEINKHVFSEEDIKIATHIRENPQNLEVSEWFESIPRDPKFSSTIKSTEKIKIKGHEALRVKEVDYFGNEAEAVLISLGNGKILEVGVLPANSDTLEVFNQVVNSLEFK